MTIAFVILLFCWATTMSVLVIRAIESMEKWGKEDPYIEMLKKNLASSKGVKYTSLSKKRGRDGSENPSTLGEDCNEQPGSAAQN